MKSKNLSTFEETMRKLLLLLSFALLPGLLWGQGPTIGTITAQDAGSCATANGFISTQIPVNGGAASITLAGTWSGTVSFLASADYGRTFVAIYGYAPNSTTGVTTSTSNGTWQFRISGLTNLCAAATTYSSGTVRVTIPQPATVSLNNGAGGSGSGTVSGQANGVIPLATAATTIGAQSHCDDGITTSGTVTCSEPFNATSISAGTAPTACGSATGCFAATGNSIASTQTSSQGSYRLDSTSGFWLWRNQNGAQEYALNKGSCTEVWGGSGTSFAMTSGDDAIVNNGCYNDSGYTRTITAVKCRSDAASNTTTVNPTFGADGTGTTILSGALTCGNSYAFSASGTVSNASWTTGTGIRPAMGGTLTGTTSIAMIVEYTY